MKPASLGKAVCDCKIFSANGKSKKEVQRVDLTIDTPTLSLHETLMCEFKFLNLSHQEKKNLSRSHRKYLCRFKNLNLETIEDRRDQLINQLIKYDHLKLHIKAEEEGALICLAAILSGKLPSHADWHFELSELALPLFPKKLVKNHSMPDSFNINFTYKKDGFIHAFPSLKKAPSYLGLKGRAESSTEGPNDKNYKALAA